LVVVLETVVTVVPFAAATSSIAIPKHPDPFEVVVVATWQH